MSSSFFASNFTENRWHRSPEVMDPVCSSSGSLLYHVSISKESKVNIQRLGLQHEAAAEVTPTYPVHTKGGILITGASTGIGLHAAQHLSALGFRVYAGVRSSKAAEQVKQAGGEDFLGLEGERMPKELWGLNTLNTCSILCCWKSDMIWWKYLPGVEIWHLIADQACRKAQDISPKKVHQWLSGDLVPVILDVTLESTVESAYETITKDLEQHALMLVGLVNCAGLSRCKNSTQKKTTQKKILPGFSRCFNGVSIPIWWFCSNRFSPGVYHWNWNLWRWSKTFMKSLGGISTPLRAKFLGPSGQTGIYIREDFWARSSTQI